MRSKIPSAYFKEFLSRQTELIRSRVRLLCFLTVGIFFSVTLAGFLITPEEFKIQETAVWAAVLAGSLAVIGLDRRARTLPAAKLNAWLFSGLLLACLTYLGVLYHEYINLCPALYLFLLFLIAFTLPWSGAEIIPLSLAHLAAYSALFFYVRAQQGFAEGRSDLQIERYGDGVILLAMGLVLSFVVRRKETARDEENFVLLKEVEAKNEQMRRELELATRIHKTLVPRSVSTDLADVAVMYLPLSYIGGDYAKFHFIDNEKLLFIICDVTGHGVSAALLVNRIHTEFERLAREGLEPGVLLKELNDFITGDFEGIPMYMSAFCGLLDFGKAKLFYSNHGHPAQYIYRITKSDIHRLPSQGTLLGLPLADGRVHQHEIEFSAGDKILLFTDGVTETKNAAGQQYGEARFEDFIKRNHGLGANLFNQNLLEELDRFKDGNFSDDIFILSIHVKAGPAGPRP